MPQRSIGKCATSTRHFQCAATEKEGRLQLAQGRERRHDYTFMYVFVYVYVCMTTNCLFVQNYANLLFALQQFHNCFHIAYCCCWLSRIEYPYGSRIISRGGVAELRLHYGRHPFATFREYVRHVAHKAQNVASCCRGPALER